MRTVLVRRSDYPQFRRDPFVSDDWHKFVVVEASGERVLIISDVNRHWVLYAAFTGAVTPQTTIEEVGGKAGSAWGDQLANRAATIKPDHKVVAAGYGYAGSLAVSEWSSTHFALHHPPSDQALKAEIEAAITAAVAENPWLVGRK